MSNWIDYYKSEDSAVKRLTGKQGPSKLPSPPGYNEQNYKLVREGRLIADNARLANKNKQKDEELERLKRSKLWEMVIQPTKSIPMNAIMMWMTP
ncbi:DEKNAAC105647, partial [Brettanomyces naardenensis]